VSIEALDITPNAAIECKYAAPTDYWFISLACEFFKMVPELFFSSESAFATATEDGCCGALVSAGGIKMAYQLSSIPPALPFACNLAAKIWHVSMFVAQVIDKFYRTIELFLA